MTAPNDTAPSDRRSAPTVDVAAIRARADRWSQNLRADAQGMRAERLIATYGAIADDYAESADVIDALCARVAALEAERDGLRAALQRIADGGLPDVGAALYSDNADEAYADGFGRGCAHVAQMAARALTPEAARDAGRARGEG